MGDRNMKERIISMSQKKKIIFSVIAVLALVLVAVYIWKTHFASGYRTIKIYEVNGTASLERENAEKMQAYENLVLKDQDLLDVAAESNVRLQMDDDKYALVEQNSVISIEAQGDSENSKTDIILEKGTVVTEIRNKLGASETYKVTTPNAVMAVRGTVFRVEQTTNENAEEVAKLTVFDGIVSIQTRNSDGSLSEETLIESGQAADVIGQGDEAQLICYEAIDYSNLTSETLEFLRDMIDEQQEDLVISRDDLSDLLQDRQSDDTADAASNATSEYSEDATEPSDTNAEEDSSLENESREEDSDTDDDEEDSDSKNKAKSEEDKDASNNKNKTKKNDKSKSLDKENEDDKKKSTTKTKSDSKKSSSDKTKNNTKTQKDKTKATTAANASKNTTQAAATESNSNQATTQQGNAAATTQAQSEPIYTVTFTYNGNVFATQKVKEGCKVKKPILKPASTGEWKFDFDTVITSDVTISFE